MTTYLIAGFAGGLAAEMLGVLDLRHSKPDELPDYVKSWFYWFCVLVLSLLGAGLVGVYHASGVGLEPILAVNIGASAPLVLRQASRVTPEIPPGSVN